MPSFSQRTFEFHHGLDLDPEGVESQRAFRDLSTRAGEIGLNQAIMGESWPKGLSRVVMYDESLPELASAMDQEAIATRRKAYDELADHLHDCGLEIIANVNLLTYPDAFPELFRETKATWSVAADRTNRPYTPDQPFPVCPTSEPVLRYLGAQARGMLELPHVNGISCWLNTGTCTIFECACERCDATPLDELIATVMAPIHEACKERGATLYVRTYLGSWQCGLETVTFQELAKQLPDDIRITYKEQQGDMYNAHPINPLLKTLAPHAEHIEFDCYGEYRGTSFGVVASRRHDIVERVQKAADAGIEGVVMRGLHHDTPFCLDVDLIGALANDPGLDLDAWSRQWAAERVGLGGNDADTLLSILDGAWSVCQGTMYVQGVNWASWNSPENLDRIRFILYDRSASCIEGAFERLELTDAMIESTAADLADAVELAAELVTKAASLRDTLPNGLGEQLVASMQSLHAYAVLVQPFVVAVLRTFQWERLVSSVAREYRRLELLPLIEQGAAAADKAEAAFAAIDPDAIAPLLVDMQQFGGTSRACLLNGVTIIRSILREMTEHTNRPPASFTGIVPLPHRWPGNAKNARDYFGDK